MSSVSFVSGNRPIINDKNRPGALSDKLSADNNIPKFANRDGTLIVSNMKAAGYIRF